MNGFHGPAPVAANTFATFFESIGGDRDRSDGACEFDVVAWGNTIIAAALHPHVVAQIAEALIVEDKCGSPAFQVDSCGDTCGAFDGDLCCPPLIFIGTTPEGAGRFRLSAPIPPLISHPTRSRPPSSRSNLRRSTTELDPPRNGGAERNFRRALTPVEELCTP